MLAVTAILSTGLVLSAPAGAASAFDSTPQASVPTNHPQIFAFTAPEAGFNPETASAADLQRHGLPPRPDATAHPQAFRTWQDVIRHAKHEIKPEFTPRPARKGPSFKYGTGSSLNWSGASASVPSCTSIFCRAIVTRPRPIVGVEGYWTVPAVEGGDGIGTVSSWVGIDGASNNQVQQIGTDATHTSSGFAVYDAWFELFPDVSQTIGNYFVAPGDQMFAMVQYYGSSNSLWFYMVDLSRNEYVSFMTTAKYGNPGNSAEWIMERPAFNNNFNYPLPPFAPQSLTGLWFWNDQGAWYPSNSTGPYTSKLIDMYGYSGNQLDQTTAAYDPNNASILITWLNYL